MPAVALHHRHEGRQQPVHKAHREGRGQARLQRREVADVDDDDGHRLLGRGPLQGVLVPRHLGAHALLKAGGQPLPLFFAAHEGVEGVEEGVDFLQRPLPRGADLVDGGPGDSDVAAGHRLQPPRHRRQRPQGPTTQQRHQQHGYGSGHSDADGGKAHHQAHGNGRLLEPHQHLATRGLHPGLAIPLENGRVDDDARRRPLQRLPGRRCIGEARPLPRGDDGLVDVEDHDGFHVVADDGADKGCGHSEVRSAAGLPGHGHQRRRRRRHLLPAGHLGLDGAAPEGHPRQGHQRRRHHQRRTHNGCDHEAHQRARRSRRRCRRRR